MSDDTGATRSSRLGDALCEPPLPRRNLRTPPPGLGHDTPPQEAEPTYYGAFAPLRVVAAFGIVGFHAGAAWGEVGYAGLPLFLVMSLFLLGQTRAWSGWQLFASRRAQRLLLPWAIWSVIYLALHDGMRWLETGSATPTITLSGLLTGGRLHLWYLPAAFLAGLLVVAIRSTVHRTSLLAGVGTSLVCFASLLMLRWFIVGSAGIAIGAPWAQWLFAAPALPIALALARIQGEPQKPKATRWIAGFSAVSIVILLLGPGTPDQRTAYAIAIPLFSLGLCVRLTPFAWLERLAELTLGIYILHPLTAALVVRSVSLERASIACIVSSFALAAVVAAALRRLPHGRLIV